MSAFDRSWFVASLAVARGSAGAFASGCRGEAAEQVAATSESAAPAPTDDASALNPDPIITKTYRVDACYFGSLTFHQARTAYLGSLGGAEPGPAPSSAGGPGALPDRI